jgi:hypothetical protein
VLGLKAGVAELVAANRGLQLDDGKRPMASGVEEGPTQLLAGNVAVVVASPCDYGPEAAKEEHHVSEGWVGRGDEDPTHRTSDWRFAPSTPAERRTR